MGQAAAYDISSDGSNGRPNRSRNRSDRRTRCGPSQTRITSRFAA